MESPPANWVRLQVWSPDSVALYASYFPARDREAPVALLLHDRGGQGSDLMGLAESFQASGIPVLLPDLRGEGESVTSRRGNVAPARQWGEPEKAILARDAEAICAFADAQETLRDRPWLAVAVGEAAPLAFALADSLPRFERLALLSPRSGSALPLEPGGRALPVLLFACDEDSVAAAAVRGLYELLPAGMRRMDLLPCRSRGSRMLRWVPELTERLSAWARRDAEEP